MMPLMHYRAARTLDHGPHAIRRRELGDGSLRATVGRALVGQTTSCPSIPMRILAVVAFFGVGFILGVEWMAEN
jgi:hypothetical protein